MSGLDELKRRYPWPDACPNVPDNPDGWFCGENRAVLQRRIGDADIVLELGAWLGLSTRFLVDHCPGTVITIDHWKGSSEHKGRPELATLWETFVKNSWSRRGRLIPVKADVIAGMREIHSLGITPKVVYVDAAHEADAVPVHLTTVIELWPDAAIIGDDWTWDSVRAGVFRVLSSVNNPGGRRHLIGRTTCYEILPEGASAQL